jgi:glutamate--cysteine ligase
MSDLFKEFLDNKKNNGLLAKTILGIERESVRTDERLNISHKRHPVTLGSAYTHPLIKTDFSESQVEYSTKPSSKTRTVLKSLSDLHSYTIENLEEEFLWPFSMPPRLPEKEEDIPLAYYGDTLDAKKKTIYRKGLGYRYGRRMQTISGVHINLSFSKALLDWVSRKRFGKPLDRGTQSQLYLDTIRNFNRYSFLILYFFGASPVLDKSFASRVVGLKELTSDTLFGEHATTLRLSELGYTSQVQNTLYISFNSLQEYIQTLCSAINTRFPGYSKIDQLPSMDGPNQLNDFYLQLENEYYTLVRPKQIPKPQERPIDSLNRRGIRYLEIRCIDADPFSPIGVSEEAILYTQIFLLYCLLKESPEMNESERKIWDENQREVVWNGRNLETLYTVLGESQTIAGWGNEVLDSMEKIAVFWDLNTRSNKYSEVVKNQRFKLSHPEETPSGAILKILDRDKIGFLELGERLGKKYKFYLLQRGVDQRIRETYQEMTKVSWTEMEEIEKNSPKMDDRLNAFIKNENSPTRVTPSSEYLADDGKGESRKKTGARPNLIELAKICGGRP